MQGGWRFVYVWAIRHLLCNVQGLNDKSSHQKPQQYIALVSRGHIAHFISQSHFLLLRKLLSFKKRSTSCSPYKIHCWIASFVQFYTKPMRGFQFQQVMHLFGGSYAFVFLHFFLVSTKGPLIAFTRLFLVESMLSQTKVTWVVPLSQSCFCCHYDQMLYHVCNCKDWVPQLSSSLNTFLPNN